MKDEIDVYQLIQIENVPFQAKDLAKATVEDHGLFSIHEKLLILCAIYENIKKIFKNQRW